MGNFWIAHFDSSSCSSSSTRPSSPEIAQNISNEGTHSETGSAFSSHLNEVFVDRQRLPTPNLRSPQVGRSKSLIAQKDGATVHATVKKGEEEDKPPIADLECFLEFQFDKIWAPIHSDLPLGSPTNEAIPTQPLQLNLMGPKLYVNTTQVTVSRMPVTGMRLSLEGNKCNRLAIHLQHLSNTPALLENKINEELIWRGSDDLAHEWYFEPLQSKKFSHICTAPVKYDPRWTTTHDAAFVVAGAQLHVAKHDSKSVLHLRLLFAKVSNASVCRSMWEQGYSGFSQKWSFLSACSTTFTEGSEKEKQKPAVIIDSGVFPTGPPVPVQTQKLLKFVDTSQVCKGAQDSPRHWLVTGAKLNLENGKICLTVKFSILNFNIS